jgi:hypothetical protein
MNDLSPLVSEFETTEQAESYLRWLEAKAAESRADGRPTVAHEEAMARVRGGVGKRRGRALKRHRLRASGALSRFGEMRYSPP